MTDVKRIAAAVDDFHALTHRRALVRTAADDFEAATRDEKTAQDAVVDAARRRALAVWARYVLSEKTFAVLAAELEISAPRVGQLVGLGRAEARRRGMFPPDGDTTPTSDVR